MRVTKDRPNIKLTQRGATMLEVLISLLIFSTALLALAALHTRALQFNHSAYVRSQVNVLAADLFDRMRLNSNALSGYTLALTPAADSGSSGSPAGSSRAAVDIAAWRKSIAAVVPEAKVKIACDSDRICNIDIIWDYQIGTGNLSVADKTNQMSFSTKI